MALCDSSNGANTHITKSRDWSIKSKAINTHTHINKILEYNNLVKKDDRAFIKILKLYNNKLSIQIMY